MGRFERMQFFARPESAARQMERVQLQTQLKWPGGGVKLESALKVSEESSVFRGYRGREPVVIKKFWDPGTRRGFVGGTVQALRRFERLGAHPEFSANRCFATSGKLGLVVVSFESGAPVNKLLKQPAANRPQILRQCCAWQSWASQGKVVRAALPANRFAEEINAILDTCAPHPDAALLTELGKELLRLLELIGDQPAARTPGHPDFAPRNLILRPDGGVAAIDIHRRGTFFRSRQTAIFLVSKDFQSAGIDGPLLYGLDSEEMKQFLAQDTDFQEESDSFLVFFIGLTLLRMYAKNTKRVRRMKLRHRRIQAYLDDVRQGRRIKS
ncbi:hypothetical protein K3720_03300 [Leisingera caerulea]|uniref:hypothetical protein n=1 Tax=Leisingera caerulea TaxID=506591 RepID=UPI0021A49A20|nr:hypothetical protein [Leisingera caerulea]UWQ50449.1 hypothetical protein K3720_03300 [Leisingera caerulea]